MATYFIGVNNGAGIGGGTVTSQATTTSKDVELVINSTANVPTKNDLYIAIQKISDYLVTLNQAW